MLATAALISDLQDILSGVIPAPTAAAAGAAWADCYSVYTTTGEANAVPVVVPAPATSALGSALGAAFSTLPGLPATVASDVASALSVFWAACTVAGMISPPVAAAGLPALIATLTAIFFFIGGTHASKANDIGTALDVFTKAVVVTFPGPSPFPVV